MLEDSISSHGTKDDNVALEVSWVSVITAISFQGTHHLFHTVIQDVLYLRGAKKYF